MFLILIRHRVIDTTHHFFNTPVTKAKPVIEENTIIDDAGWETVTFRGMSEHG